MSYTKIILGLTVLVVLCITYAHSIQCYSCNDKKSCSSSKPRECNASMANQTRLYLDVYHKNVSNATSPNFECFREHHKSKSGEFFYKGCISSNVRGCNLEMREYYTQGKYTRDCNQCNNKNGCNPAGRAELHIGVPLVAIILAVVGKFAWST